MRPIVDGLKAEAGAAVAFVDLDAVDGGNGQRWFEQLGLPGHPAVVIFDADGREVFREVGVIPVERLRAALPQTAATPRS